MEDIPDLKKTLSPYGVSHITQNLKSLRTISNKTKNEPFMLFTHHKKLK